MSTIEEQKKLIESEIKKLEDMSGSVTVHAKRFRDNAFSRFPILLIFLSTFGLVSTLYGFEKVIDQIDFFETNPLMVLVMGIITLAITGSLFKKLKWVSTYKPALSLNAEPLLVYFRHEKNTAR